MTPQQLQAENFAAYSPGARSFAIKHLPLLRQLPLSVCPSFLAQIILWDTRFPAERADLEHQCSQLAAMQPARLDALLLPLRTLQLPADLASSDWVMMPSVFIERLSAVLWADGQIDQFHGASRQLLSAVQPLPDNTQRLLLIALGRGANLSSPHLMRKLAERGLRLEALQPATVPSQMVDALQSYSQHDPEPYAHWYVDGGESWPLRGPSATLTQTSYDTLRPLREQVLLRMRATVRSQQSNAEDLRTILASTDSSALGGDVVSSDPLLQAFYTQLFTQGSGTQIFSTSFVQWAGRELARRVKPKTMLLRYAPRQRYRSLNEIVDRPAERQMDVQGSLGDAEMAAFYNWIDMDRISAGGRLTTLVWAEGSSRAVLIGPQTKPRTVSQKPLTVAQAIAAMRT